MAAAVRRIDARKISNETAVVATETVRTGLGGDGGNEMTETAAVQAWLMIIRRQQQENGDCGDNVGGANLAWLGGSGKTARQQKNQR